MSPQIDPVDVQFHVVHDCIRACVYADHIAQNGIHRTAWVSLADICYADAVISWNGIFGSNAQPSHWKNLIERLPVPESSNLIAFSSDVIAAQLGVDESEWIEYHRNMVQARNDWLAHFNSEAAPLSAPSLHWALQSACLYRTWLLSLLAEYKRQGKNIEVTETTSEDAAAQFRKEISEVCP